MNYLWDLDGTLLDSYPVILKSLKTVLKAQNLPISETLGEEILRSSVRAYLGTDELFRLYYAENERHQSDVRAMPGALETLRALSERGDRHFVYTHRGESAFAVLEQNGLLRYFTEVLTAESGFPRKPDPAALLYLMEKHGFSPDEAFYVGDRALDIEAARNAGIPAILYLPEGSPVRAGIGEARVVRDLREIAGL